MPLTLIVNNGAVVKDRDGTTVMRHVLPREVARAVCRDARVRGQRRDRVRSARVDDERQIVFERMDWTHPNRRGYYEKNKAFIAAAPAPLADMLDARIRSR